MDRNDIFTGMQVVEFWEYICCWCELNEVYWYEVLTSGMVVSSRVQRKRRIVTSSTMSWAGLYLQLELLHGWDWLSLQCHHHLPLHPSDRSCAGMDFSIDHIIFTSLILYLH